MNTRSDWRRTAGGKPVAALGAICFAALLLTLRASWWQWILLGLLATAAWPGDTSDFSEQGHRTARRIEGSIGLVLLAGLIWLLMKRLA